MPDKQVMRFGEKLRTLRTSRKLTLRALGALIGVPHSTIVEIENGNNKPGIDFIYTVATFFGVSADVLLDDERDV